MSPPVITIDGPSGAGKGTVAMKLAQELQYHLLDSGAVYRAAAVHVLQENIDPHDEKAVVAAVKSMRARFETVPGKGVQVFLNNSDFAADLRNEGVASIASAIAVIEPVRTALMNTQRDFCRPPGLVADGRDMGTVVFPDAWLKIFLTASAEERASRRYKQLNKKELSVTLESLLHETQVRDQRDATRSVSPMVPASDALVIDSTGITVEQVMQQLRELIARKKQNAE